MTEPLKPELTVAEKVCELVRLTQRLAPDSTSDGARLLLMAAAALLRDRDAFLEDARIAWGVMVGNREDHG